MNDRSRLIVLLTLSVLVSSTFTNSASPPTRSEVEGSMGLGSAGDITRGQMDTVGFVVSAEQAEDVISKAVELEKTSMAAQDKKLGMAQGEGFAGGICPHDDHLYAARAYVHLTERISAPRIILIGVFHAARLWDLDNVLVFDSFQAWRGPWGPVPVDSMRGNILGGLPHGAAVVDNSMHCREHSLEAIIPFLQRRNPDVRIVPILVPYADWQTLSDRAGELSTSIADTMRRKGWQLGRDVAIVISSDAVHYGPDFDHAPFGADAAAYQQAVDRDLGLLGSRLEGPIEPSRLEDLLYDLVDEEDVRRYKIPWCGRFSVPFGLELLRRVSEELHGTAPEGHLLRYATSLSEPELPVTAATKDAGLGKTAPSNHHHWVGYATVGFTLPKRSETPS